MPNAGDVAEMFCAALIKKDPKRKKTRNRLACQPVILYNKEQICNIAVSQDSKSGRETTVR